MQFEDGNKAAEKWTEETVLPIVEQILSIAQTDECVWLGSALVSVGLYKDIWNYWKDKFNNENSPVFRTIKLVDQIFEDKLYKNGLKGNYVPALTIFGLKNNHGWRDKNELDVTSDGKVLASPTYVTNQTGIPLAGSEEEIEDKP